jgi:hypothetical protein
MLSEPHRVAVVLNQVRQGTPRDATGAASLLTPVEQLIEAVAFDSRGIRKPADVTGLSPLRATQASTDCNSIDRRDGRAPHCPDGRPCVWCQVDASGPLRVNRSGVRRFG